MMRERISTRFAGTRKHNGFILKIIWRYDDSFFTIPIISSLFIFPVVDHIWSAVRMWRRLRGLDDFDDSGLIRHNACVFHHQRYGGRQLHADRDSFAVRSRWHGDFLSGIGLVRNSDA